MASGIATEFEEMGVVALIGLLLLPGAVWISKARTGGNMAMRATVVGVVMFAAVAIEASMDRTANAVGDAV